MGRAADIVLLTAGAARSVADALDDLADEPRACAGTWRSHRGLASRGCRHELGRDLGKHEAHALVEAASRRAAAEDRPLADVLAKTRR